MPSMLACRPRLRPGRGRHRRARLRAAGRSGLVLIYRTNRVLNFAQGQLGVVAAVFMVKLDYDFGINYWAALVAAVALAAAVGGTVRAGAAPPVQPSPGPGHGGHHRPGSGALACSPRCPSSGPQKLYKPFPVPFDWSFTLGLRVIAPARSSP